MEYRIKKLKLVALAAKPYKVTSDTAQARRITIAPMAKLAGGELLFQYRDEESGAIILSHKELT